MINNTHRKTIVLLRNEMQKKDFEIIMDRIDIKSRSLLQECHQSLEKHIPEATIEGRRGRGKQTRRWTLGIEEWLRSTTTTQAGRLAEDRLLVQRKV